MANAESMKKLNKRRGTHKMQITNFHKFIEDSTLQGPDQIRVMVRLDKFKASFVDFDEVSDNLEIFDEDHDHASERFQIEEQYLDLVAEAEHLIKKALSTTPQVSVNNVNYETIREHLTSTVTKRRIKLPEASLPKFSGKYEDWLSFEDAFTSMIHNQTDLNNIEKLQYLKSAVTNEAANKIKNLSITDGNYDRAWKLLKSAYADKRLIISRHLSLLLRLPIQEKESAEGLRRLADETQQHIESLKSLEINLNEEIVVQILEEKLNKLMAEKWEESLKRDTFPRLEEMFEFLYKTASRLSKRDREKIEQTSSQAANKSSQPVHKKSFLKKGHRQAFLSKIGKPCPICLDSQHPVYKCSKFRTYAIPKRIQAARDAFLCLNCLRSHRDKSCNFSKCMICEENHNTLLHIPPEKENPHGD